MSGMSHVHLVDYPDGVDIHEHYQHVLATRSTQTGLCGFTWTPADTHSNDDSACSHGPCLSCYSDPRARG